MSKKVFFVFLIISVLVFVVIAPKFVLAAGVPNGATITPQSNKTAGTGTAGEHAAIAGNLTELVVTGFTSTQSWQGYYGNVSGTIQLADGSSNVFYNWSQANAEGEILASNTSSVQWSTISCFDMATRKDSVEGTYNIGATDVDGLNETFSGNTHPAFTVAAASFGLDTCNATKVFGPNAAATFTEVLLDDGLNNIVFASLLADDTVGFDNAPHDFEMLVLEDGHGTDVVAVTYYFFVELG